MNVENLDSLKEDNLLVYIIKTSDNARLKGIRILFNGAEKSAKTVVKDTESQRKFNRMLTELCQLAVLSLPEMEDALFELANPGHLASEANPDEITEVTEKELIRSMAKYLSVGSKLGVTYMENVGNNAVKSKTHKRREQAPPQPKSKAKRLKEAENIKAQKELQETAGSLDALALYASQDGMSGLKLKDVGLRMAASQFEPLRHSWLLAPPDTLATSRSMGRERKMGLVSSSPPTVIEICLTEHPATLLQRWESREATIAEMSGLVPCRKRTRRGSPAHSGAGTGRTPAGESSELSRIAFFPHLHPSYAAEIAPSVLRSIVYCGVPYLDLPCQ